MIEPGCERLVAQSRVRRIELCWAQGRAGPSHVGHRVAWGTGQMRAGSVDRSVDWIQVMDHGAITLGDE
jgi:hypothetical protein